MERIKRVVENLVKVISSEMEMYSRVAKDSSYAEVDRTYAADAYENAEAILLKAQDLAKMLK